jgi:hypothetical protein
MREPKKKCCRSTPRCGRCPVLLKAQARARVGRYGLVEEILGGHPEPRLPACVEAALTGLG